MNFQDPVIAYHARSAVDAHLACTKLQDEGIEALVVEERSAKGGDGESPWRRYPQIWVDRVNLGRARGLLIEQEQKYELRKADVGGVEDPGPPILVVCDACGETTEFPALRKGTVQECPRCFGYVDVGPPMEMEGWDEIRPEDDKPDA